MRLKTFLLLVFISQYLTAQIPSDFFFAKEYSKELTLYKAKAFVINEIIKDQTSIVKFEVDPLAAASSGELTTLVYKCDEKKLEGMVLGFYGVYWNNYGVVYQGYAFKNLPRNEAQSLMDKISSVIEDNKDYLKDNPDNNNIYFTFDDLTVLVYYIADTKIRLFWRDFDADWNITAFTRTSKRFEKKLR